MIAWAQEANVAGFRGLQVSPTEWQLVHDPLLTSQRVLERLPSGVNAALDASLMAMKHVSGHVGSAIDLVSLCHR